MGTPINMNITIKGQIGGVGDDEEMLQMYKIFIIKLNLLCTEYDIGYTELDGKQYIA